MAKLQTSILVESLSGKAGQVVFVNTRHGVLARPRVTPVQPNSPKQMQRRAALALAAKAWSSLTTSQISAWQAYAATIEKIDSVTGEVRSPIAYNVFCALATKLLQIDPAITLPTTPPTGPLVVEVIKFTLVPGPRSFLILATTYNTAGHTAEILVQPLANAHRRPIGKRYETAIFQAFSASVTHKVISESAGTYAVAYRIVDPNTGQAAPIIPIGTVTAT